MQRALIDPPVNASSPEANPAFNVVIAYEDFETGKHAKKTYDFLVARLGEDFQFSNQMWKFDILGIPKLRQIAANDAALADIIMISCHGATALPTHVMEWIDSWSSVKGGPIALAALFDSEPELTRDIRARLAQVAARAGIEYFAQPDEWPGNSQNLQRFAPPLGIDVKTLSTLAGSVRREITPRWGINE